MIMRSVLPGEILKDELDVLETCLAEFPRQIAEPTDRVHLEFANGRGADRYTGKFLCRHSGEDVRVKNCQTLETISPVGKSGRRSRGTRNGNNAAWVCCTNGCCVPLLASGLGSVRDKLVRRGECGATCKLRFRVNKPSEVNEVQVGQTLGQATVDRRKGRTVNLRIIEAK